MIDTGEALSRRMSDVSTVQGYIFNAWEKYLRMNNKFAKAYQTMAEKMKEEENLARSQDREERELKLLFTTVQHECKGALSLAT